MCRDPSDQGPAILHSHFHNLFLPCETSTHLHLLHRKKAVKHQITVGREQRCRKGSWVSLLASCLQAIIYIPYIALFSENSLQMRNHKKTLVLHRSYVFVLNHTSPMSHEEDTVLHCLIWHRTGMLSLLTIITAIVKPRSISWRKYVCHALKVTPAAAMLQRCLE